MMYVFRKEMRKWHSVLWLVLASLVLSSVFLIFRKPHAGEVVVASVNKSDVLFKQYREALNEIKLQIDSYREYARSYGVSMDLFLNLAGLDNPEQAALDRCIKNALIDQEKDLFNIQLSSEYFGEQLIRILPPQLLTPTGDIDMQAYKFHLNNRLFTTIADFETSKEEAFEREFFQHFVKNSYYVSNNSAKEIFESNNLKKKFYILNVPFDSFLKDTKNVGEPTKDELNAFFQKNKEDYRVPEKRKTDYWTISSQEYEKKISVDDDVIRNFYEKNKSGLYRIPPKIKVQHILLKLKEDSSPGETTTLLEKAKEIHNQLKDSAAKFETVIKKYSQDKALNTKTGVLDFFERGTHDPDFEKAAFHLKKNGEISDVVKTSDGYEIIQLLERVPAREKPLETVKDEIIKTIKAKKSLTALQGDLERVLYKAKTDKEAISKFIKENNLKSHQTDLLTKKDGTSGHELDNILAEKMFSGRKKEVQGYFVHEGVHVLYKQSELQSSTIPSLDSVKKEVTSDYYEVLAQKKIKANITDIKREVLNSKLSLKDVSKKRDLKLIETDSIKKGDDIDDLKFGKKLSGKAFILNDSVQVLTYKDNQDYYLVQMAEADKPDLDAFAQKKNSIIKETRAKEKNLYLEAFIASLLRNAKIEKSEKMLNTNVNAG